MKLFVAVFLTIAILYHAYYLAGEYKNPYPFRSQLPIYWAPHIIMLASIWINIAMT